MPVLFREGKVVFDDAGKVVFTDDPNSCDCCGTGDCTNCTSGNSTSRVRITIAGVTNNAAHAGTCDEAHDCDKWNTSFILPDDYLEDIQKDVGCNYGTGNLVGCPDKANAVCDTDASAFSTHYIRRLIAWAATVSDINVDLLTIVCAGGTPSGTALAAGFALTTAAPHNCMSGVYVLDFVGVTGAALEVCDFSAATVTLEFIP